MKLEATRKLQFSFGEIKWIFRKKKKKEERRNVLVIRATFTIYPLFLYRVSVVFVRYRVLRMRHILLTMRAYAERERENDDPRFSFIVRHKIISFELKS